MWPFSCRHDWEVAKEYQELRLYIGAFNDYWCYIEELKCNHVESTSFPATDQVCLKCGACRSDKSEAVAAIDARWQREDDEKSEAKHRKELAKRMYKGCK